MNKETPQEQAQRMRDESHRDEEMPDAQEDENYLREQHYREAVGDGKLK